MAESPRLGRVTHKLTNPLERRLASIVGRLITDKLAYSRLDRLPDAVSELATDLRRIEGVLTDMAARIERFELIGETALETSADATARLMSEQERVRGILQLIYDQEPETRRRLWQLRTSSTYSLAFEEPEPLVSIVIPTYENHEALRERSLPSAIAQTYANIEIVVVGDCAPPETAATIAECNDERIRYHNLALRGPYSQDPHKLWLVGGTPPYNTAVRLARGRWIACLGDDDSFRHDHLERLLQQARADHLELCYGILIQHNPDGSEVEIGSFPPIPGQFGLQASIYHAGLSDFLELELADSEFGTANDMGLLRRMLRAGVRMGMVREPTSDYFPSWDWGGRKERHAEWEAGPPTRPT
jgi:hypothetical protein